MRRITLSLILTAGLALWPGFSSGPTLTPDRYYGAADNGLLLRVEDDEGQALYLQVSVVDDRGRSRQLLRPLRLKPAVGNDRVYEEAGPARGTSVKVRVLFDKDGTALQWLQPAELNLADGVSIQIAGRHALLSESNRKAAAERHFALADKGLNDLYNRLRREMTPGNFAELRTNQLQWLKYRDRFIADGDDSEINGPGSIPFRQAQTARTLERTAFLGALGRPSAAAVGLGGRYSDGIDWEIRLVEDPQIEERVFFTLQYSLSQRRGPEWPLPVVVSGCGSWKAAGRSWTLTGQTVTGGSAETENEIRLTPAADRRSLEISGSTLRPFSVRLRRVADLSPAEEPMRAVLMRLPAAIFDETTEGLSEPDKKQLLLTGASGPFQLEEPATDFVRVRYRDGQVDLRRFPEADGGAVIAVATANLRARSFGLWRISAADQMSQSWPLNQALPPLGASDFYQEPDDAAAASRGMLEFSLRSNLAEIHADWARLKDGPEPDIDIDLVWNGVGFDIVRSARPAQRHHS
jgi:uncharacterized protein YecT (DUF1311 family)